MLSAAQTENESKHDLLSRLVAERIKASPESMLSLASKMACDAISYTTPNQLKILGLLTNILYVEPSSIITDQSQYMQWLQARTTQFLDVNANRMDYTHLESLSCMKFEAFITRDLSKILSGKFKGTFNYEDFKQSQLGERLVDIWENKALKNTQLTTVGQIIGVMVIDQYVGGKTNMEGWGA